MRVGKPIQSRISSAITSLRRLVCMMGVLAAAFPLPLAFTAAAADAQHENGVFAFTLMLLA